MPRAASPPPWSSSNARAPSCGSCGWCAWRDRLHVLDVNGDAFEVRGVGYADAEVVPLLDMVNTAYNPQTIHQPTEAEHKELKTGRRHPWAEDRVM